MTAPSSSTAAAKLSVADRSRLGRRAQLLAAVSVGYYNAVEAVIAVAAGAAASPTRKAALR